MATTSGAKSANRPGIMKKPVSWEEKNEDASFSLAWVFIPLCYAAAALLFKFFPVWPNHMKRSL